MAQFKATVWRRFAMIQMFGGRSKLVQEAVQAVNEGDWFAGQTISQMLPYAAIIDRIFFKLLQDGKIGAESNEGE